MAKPLLAAPSITSHSGTPSNGNVVIWNGSGLGTATVARPLKFEGVESGAFISTWTSTSELSITAIANQQRWSGSNRAITGNIIDAAQDKKFIETDTVYPTWRVDFWVKISTNFDWGTPCPSGDPTCPNAMLANIKIIRFWNPGSNIENVVIAYNGVSDELYIIAENVPGEVTRFAYDPMSTRHPKGSWALWRCEFVENSGLDATDGQLRLWINGERVKTISDMSTRSGDTEYKRPRVIGFENEWGAGSNGEKAPNEIFMDDVVVDNKLNAVYVSSCSTWETLGCAYEYQLANSFASTAVSSVFSQGSLPSGTAYAWIVDENGGVNASGYQFTIGGAGTTNLNASFSGVTSSSLTASWSTISGNNYSVAMSSFSNFSTLISSGNLATATSGYIGLNPSTTYYFEVKLSTEGSYNSAISTATLPLAQGGGGGGPIGLPQRTFQGSGSLGGGRR